VQVRKRDWELGCNLIIKLFASFDKSVKKRIILWGF
jgi:hypothetical protein